jgi:diguanylate cyclase (GGDEF)-like protein
MIERIEQDRISFDQQRRLAYRVSGALGMLLLLYAQFTQLSDTSMGAVFRTIYTVNHSVFAGFICGVSWALVRGWLPLERIERATLWFLAVEALCFNSVLPPLLGQNLPMLFRETMGDDIWFLLVICTLAIHLYSGRRGVWLAVGFYLFAFAVAAVQVLVDDAGGGGDRRGAIVIQIYVMAGVLLCFLFVLARYRDHTRLIQVEYELMERMAFSDMLTGLPNRRMGYQLLQSQIALAGRSGRSLSVCLWDIDHFKRINDTYGHDVGDQVLRAISAQLSAHLRLSDTLIRWGGEEFVVVLPETSLAAALLVAERMRVAVAGMHLADGVRATASFGVSCYDGVEMLEQLLQRADQALYAAKSAGRNRVMPPPDASEDRGGSVSLIQPTKEPDHEYRGRSRCLRKPDRGQPRRP